MVDRRNLQFRAGFVIMCWNCRGLGTNSTVGELHWLVQTYRPSLLFLSETKMRDKRVRNFMWSLGFSNSFAVSSEGQSGGLCLFWLSSVNVSLKAFNDRCIDVHVKPEHGPVWRATFVYGEPRRENRHQFWDFLRFMRAQWDGPWICCGDFNEVLRHDEHQGLRDRTNRQINDFQQCLADCGLVDMGFCGPKFTWSNRQDYQRHVKARLDRAVANVEFSNLYDDCLVENVITTSSDHYAVLIFPNKGNIPYDRGKTHDFRPVQHGFKFEAMWLRDPGYREFLERAWTEGRDGSPLSLQSTWTNLNRVAGSLKQWGKESFGSIRSSIHKLERRLKGLRSIPISDAAIMEERSLERQLCELFEREEIMARQRSRVEWLREGDRNTAFFHARASARRRTNRINSLTRNDGSITENQEEIKDEEIKFALFQMGPTKAPGPDGFPALFYQTHWDFLKEDICHAVRGFLNGMPIPDGFCDSVIVLIPKGARPKHLNNFRPISLCNVLYKIAAKVLANRLKVFLPVIISEHQSAFVPGRLITDNALIAFECLHTIRQQRSKRPYFAMKIDMTKAYDRVEWTYLHGCLSRLGFAPEWISTVMRCVTSVRYAVRVNNELTNPVIPTRGIRQGDPISPYLFLLCTEGLSSVLFHKESCGELQGIQNGRQGPPISHLLFADDSIFFARSDQRSVHSLKEALHLYCGGSGQRINLQKSSIYFGTHCSNDTKQGVMEALGVTNEFFHEKYLGMPTHVGRSPVRTFKFLNDKVWHRIVGLSDRPPSRAGKEVLLKSVVQAIPTYIMSCFRLPVAICERLRQAVADYWWGREDGKRKVHWRSWEWLSTPKKLGGMGFRDFSLFNQAMLGRQCWRLLTEPGSLCARVFKGRYFPHCDFWDAPKPRSSSYTWRSILFGRQLVKAGARWGIANGQKVKFMTDHWIPGRPPHMLQTLSPIPQNAKVSCLMADGHGSWNEENVRAFFPEETAELILQTQISRHAGDDFVYWPHNRYGLYTVRSAYILARSLDFFTLHSTAGHGLPSNLESEVKHWKAIWAIKAPNKMNIVLWRFAHDCLPSGLQLRRRNILANPACVHCGREESVEHCLLFCQFASEVWSQVKERFNIHLCRRNFRSPKQWLFDFIDRSSPQQSTVLAITVWHIWEARNAVRNDEGNIHPHCVASKIHAYVDLVMLHLIKTDTEHSRETPFCSTVKWSPPPPESVLVNVDAAVFSNLHKVGIGILIRNHNGDCLVACTEPLKGIISPELAESWALRCAVSLAHNEGFTSVVFASDCLSLVQRINSSTNDRSEVGAVVADIKLLAASFSSVSFRHVRRSLNVAAHILARSCEFVGSRVVSYSAPECIRQTLCMDAS